MNLRRACALAAVIASLLATMIATTMARAKEATTAGASAPKKIAILVEPKSAGALRGAAVDAVPDGWDAHAELKLAGTTPSLWSALDAPKHRKRALDDVRAALASQGLDAALLVRVVPTKKARVVRVLLVVRGEDDVALDEKLVLPIKPGKGDAASLRAIVAPPLTARAPRFDEPTTTTVASEATSAGAAPSSAVDRDAVADEKPPDAITPPREPMLVVSAMGELAARRFTYDGQTIGGLRPYNLPNVAAVGVALELQPLRDAQGLISGLGLAGDFHTSLGLKSTSVGSSETSTGRWTRFDGMLRWWLPLTPSHVTAIALSAGYGQERFSFSPATADLPSVAYHYARGGIDFRLRLGKGDPTRGAAVFLGSSYLLVLSGGDVAQHFRRVTTWGLEVSGGLSVYLSAAIELRLAVDYRRYSQRFGGAQPGDPFIAAGALDEMVRTLGALCLKY